MNNKFFCFRDVKLQLGKKTYIMGIINVTPDSFSDGGNNLSVTNALATAEMMERQGADILDIGGQSTRPESTVISPDEEWARLEKVLPIIISKTKLPVSVDTFYPEVAKKALEIGCHIINDVSGVASPKMAEVVKTYNAGWILMHSGKCKSEDICAEIKDGLKALLNSALQLGVEKSHICLDAGIGFGKNHSQNFKIVANTKSIKIDSNAYLLGASRKRFIGSLLPDNTDVTERDYGTVAVNAVGILGGADIIRVHNVKAAYQTIRMADALRKDFLNE